MEGVARLLRPSSLPLLLPGPGLAVLCLTGLGTVAGLCSSLSGGNTAARPVQEVCSVSVCYCVTTISCFLEYRALVVRLEIAANLL